MANPTAAQKPADATKPLTLSPRVVAPTAVASYLDEPNAGRRILARCDELGAISAPSEGVTRLYLTREHREAAETILRWMTEAGMAARIDEVGNVIGRYEGSEPAPYLIVGSHMDSVVNAGKYDGPLGVLTALDCVAVLNARGHRLPFGVEVVAFGDEEGIRFRSTLAGSRAVTGRYGDDLRRAVDGDGIAMMKALADFGLDPDRIGLAAHDPAEVAGYVELHIEQGPVLEAMDAPVGVVTAISGQSRSVVRLLSAPNHAGTVPMDMRKDPLMAASEIALTAERIAKEHEATVATVGFIEAKPGVINVIPGEVSLTIDLRSQQDSVREAAYAALKSAIGEIARRRGVGVEIELILDLKSCPCAPAFIDQIKSAVQAVGVPPICLPSGAGHDGMAMSEITEIGMIFVRCKGGISHSPEESVTEDDVTKGAAVLLSFIENFRGNANK